jgi:hypothetical protein
LEGETDANGVLSIVFAGVGVRDPLPGSGEIWVDVPGLVPFQAPDIYRNAIITRDVTLTPISVPVGGPPAPAVGGPYGRGKPLRTTQTSFRDELTRAIGTRGEEVFLEMPNSVDLQTARGESTTVELLTPRPLLLFRGDDRGPDKIYSTDGTAPFRTRNGRKRPSFKSRQGDVDKDSGTCATLLPEFTSLFPPQVDGSRRMTPERDDICVYVLVHANVFLTHRLQLALYGDPCLAAGHADIRSRLILNAASREVIVVGDIPVDHILGHFHMRREWLGRQYNEGVRFRIDSGFTRNIHCNVPERDAMEAYATQRMASFRASSWVLAVEEEAAEGDALIPRFGRAAGVDRSWRLTQAFV